MAAVLSADPSVEYAEPVPVFRTTGPDFLAEPAPPGARPTAPRAAPNDPQAAVVNYLAQLDAFSAWDVVKGQQGDVLVAIVDGGTDWRHPDLAANVWTNEDEIPDNGVDDDNNGFVDDLHGWNFPRDEPDPTGLEDTPLNAQHGTAVAGVAAAVTDNNQGIPSISWNVPFMAINAGGFEDNAIPGNFGYGGIVYAAENGADIINASWGRAPSSSPRPATGDRTAGATTTMSSRTSRRATTTSSPSARPSRRTTRRPASRTSASRSTSSRPATGFTPRFPTASTASSGGRRFRALSSSPSPRS